MNKVKRACHETVELPFSLVQSRQRISDLSLDVLIFPAIAASPFQISLTLTRLARVQMIFGHGHPVTSGSEAIDYFISSDFFHDGVRPGNADVNVDADHTEQLVRFRSLSIKWDAGYLPPGVPSIGSRDSLDTSLSKETLHDMLAALYAGQRLQYRRLPHARFYVCLQQKVKFHPAFDDVLRGILSRDGHSIIVLLESTSSSVLFDRFVRSGILSDASVGRVVYLPFMERNVYKTVLAAAVDVRLDTFPWGGGVLV